MGTFSAVKPEREAEKDQTGDNSEIYWVPGGAVSLLIKRQLGAASFLRVARTNIAREKCATVLNSGAASVPPTHSFLEGLRI